jgi:hypothetical protein
MINSQVSLISLVSSRQWLQKMQQLSCFYAGRIKLFNDLKLLEKD